MHEITVIVITANNRMNFFLLLTKFSLFFAN
jgi:hypothetical protein